MTKIYHNQRCRKSRETLAILNEKNQEIEIIDYLEKPPTKEELREILDMLGMKPEELIRKGESIFKENFKGKTLTDEEWINVLHSNPKLIERPIVVKDGKAIIGRPPENVLNIL